MFVLLFCLWLIFNAQVTVEIIAFGLIFSAAIFWFMSKYMDYSVKKDIRIISQIFYILQYIVALLIEIIKANIGSIRFVIARKKKPKPLIIRFRTDLVTVTARTLLANSIPLTPGTITISLDDDIFTVHCLDASMADGLQSSRLVQLLHRMEEVSKR